MGLLIILHCLSPSNYVINPQMAGGGNLTTSDAFLVTSFSRIKAWLFLTGELTQDDGTRSCKKL